VEGKKSRILSHPKREFSMKFCVTPTSEFRSTPNVAKFHFEGDTNNDEDVLRLSSILELAILSGVVLEFGSLTE
jgi:hypothetical protein